MVFVDQLLVVANEIEWDHLDTIRREFANRMCTARLVATFQKKYNYIIIGLW